MNGKKYFKWWSILTALLLTVTVTISQIGCLTPAQMASLKKANIAADNASAYIATKDKEIAAVRKMIKEKKIDVKVGEVIIKSLIKDKDGAKAVYKENKDAIIEMEANQTPWYGYLLYGLNFAAGIAGSFIGVRKVGAVTGAFGSIARGLDAGLEKIDAADRAEIMKSLNEHVDADETRAKAKALHNAASAGKI